MVVCKVPQKYYLGGPDGEEGLRVFLRLIYTLDKCHGLTQSGSHNCGKSEVWIFRKTQEKEEFVQSPGEHGIVVFSLGSMVKNITEEKSNTVASALAQIPQKVLWRFDGKKPDTLESNTRLYKWIPQNDLLGHPKTKAFIAHGGTNGIYEAIYHGIPIVGIPLCADQPDNINHMVAKGAAVRVDVHILSTTNLLTALKTVQNEPLWTLSTSPWMGQLAPKQGTLKTRGKVINAGFWSSGCLSKKKVFGNDCPLHGGRQGRQAAQSWGRAVAGSYLWDLKSMLINARNWEKRPYPL
ncbi:UDP-glucuronosyltransferase 2B1-like [Meriones unguiculatus]|uniref:UDP-glucuronosyltransferase 2B1-like n=1 Tax=Meriones unguiculatus TaxID=10047 RepID=UPI00293EF55D|nr:UDP-glucuronosyltransferase 2B1-like [Meriones unguiculatus]